MLNKNSDGVFLIFFWKFLGGALIYLIIFLGWAFVLENFVLKKWSSFSVPILILYLGPGLKFQDRPRGKLPYELFLGCNNFCFSDRIFRGCDWACWNYYYSDQPSCGGTGYNTCRLGALQTSYSWSRDELYYFDLHLLFDSFVQSIST